MYVTIVHIDVKPEFINAFLEASTENHLASVKEPGNMRFDLLQSEQHPNLFVFYEAYENEKTAAAHKDTPHYLKWKETVAPWMARPRKGMRYTGLQP